jgi:hypothetical protein
MVLNRRPVQRRLSLTVFARNHIGIGCEQRFDGAYVAVMGCVVDLAADLAAYNRTAKSERA